MIRASIEVGLPEKFRQDAASKIGITTALLDILEFIESEPDNDPKQYYSELN